MLRLTVNPNTLYFNHKWVMYAHLQSISSTYYSSYISLGEIYTIADFWRLINNIPSAKDLHSSTIVWHGKRIVAYSLFKEDITPEWEHPINEQGCEWGCRENMSSDLFNQMWSSLILLSVNDQIDNVAGVRCINKSNRVRSMYKIELWLDSNNEADTIHAKDMIDAMLPHHPLFTLMYHQDKQDQASEYQRRRTKSRLKK